MDFRSSVTSNSRPAKASLDSAILMIAVTYGRWSVGLEGGRATKRGNTLVAMEDEDSIKLSYMPPELKSLILWGIKLGSWGRVHLLYWDKEEERLRRRKGTPSLMTWYLLQALTYSIFIFMAGRTAQVVLEGTEGLKTQIACGFLTCNFVFPVLFQITLLMHHDELRDCFNNALKLFQDFDHGMKGKGYKNKDWILEVHLTYLLQRSIYYGLLPLVFFQMMVAIVKPDLPVFLSSLADPRSRIYSPLFTISVCLTLLVFYVFVTAAYAIIFIGSGLGFPLLHAIQALGNESLATSADVITNTRRYNAIALLLEQSYKSYCYFLIPLVENNLIMLSTFSLVGALRFSGSLRAMITSVGAMCYLILFALFYGMGEIDKRGQRLVRKWKSNPGNDRRALRCLRPYRVVLGAYGYIDKALILTATDIVLRNSITLLLAMQ